MSTLKCLIAGCAQWCPALIEIPLLSNKSATSCGCAPFTKKDTIPNLFSGFPIILIKSNSFNLLYKLQVSLLLWLVIFFMPISLIKSTAEANAIAPDILGVPGGDIFVEKINGSSSVLSKLVVIGDSSFSDNLNIGKGLEVGNDGGETIINNDVSLNKNVDTTENLAIGGNIVANDATLADFSSSYIKVNENLIALQKDINNTIPLKSVYFGYNTISDTFGTQYWSSNTILFLISVLLIALCV